MNNVYHLPTRDQLYEEASLWIAKLDRGLSAKESREFQRWLKLSDEHRETLFDMAYLWDKMDSLSHLSEVLPEKPNQQHLHFINRCPKTWFSAAAVLVLSISLALSSIITGVGSEQIYKWPKELVASVFGSKNFEGTYQTQVGEHSTIALQDGSTLILNTDSLAHVHFSGKNRIITLERGELHIDVEHDETRPLSVRAGQRVVQALGTAFNVQMQNNEVELIVTDGIVRVGERQQFDNRWGENKKDKGESLPIYLSQSSLALTEGEKVLLNHENSIVEKVNSTEMEVSLSWRKGNLIFRGETLADALTEIGRYTSVKLEVVDKDLEKVRIAGFFKAGDIPGLLSALNQNFGIASEWENGTKVYLKKDRD